MDDVRLLSYEQIPNYSMYEKLLQNLSKKKLSTYLSSNNIIKSPIKNNKKLNKNVINTLPIEVEMQEEIMTTSSSTTTKNITKKSKTDLKNIVVPFTMEETISPTRKSMRTRKSKENNNNNTIEIDLTNIDIGDTLPTTTITLPTTTTTTVTRSKRPRKSLDAPFALF